MYEDNQEMVKRLQARSGDVLKASDQALTWFNDNPKAVKGDSERIKATLRRYRRQARQLKRASHQPPAIAVFGASQSGKSYLVSSLATKPGETLEAYYQNEKLNFLQDMNPQGGNESTGLVSRFTTRTPKVLQDNMPVPLRLLSAADIIKILTNTSLEDFKAKELSMEDKQIDALFEAVSATANTINPIMDLDDIEGLMEYLQFLYADFHRLESLGDSYWDKLKAIVPYLPASESAILFSPLWNGLPQFTNLARSLFVTLEQLGQPDFVYCSTDALRPRERSILNVETLFTLGQGDTGDSIALLTPDNKTVTINRSIVTALTAEITVPVGEDAPWPFLKEIDLLDFPGARSREIIYDPQDFLQAPEALGRLFLRGKVAYLFQRYEAEREISAMLLCIGDSIQSVSTLPSMIDGWIKSSIGATAAEREKQRNNLFIVLTKFDREFEQKDGDAPSSGARWTARINASLLDFFKTSSWVEDWKNNQPFNNLYWLRSPAIKFPAVMEYQQVGELFKESAIATKAQSLVDTMRNAYLSNASIQRYVSNPEKAWEAVLQLNDGGISYLAESLGEVCDGRLKFEQISAQLDQYCANLARFIAPYYHSGNKEEAIQKASLEAQAIARSLMKCVSVQMFGPLLSALQVTREQMIEAWRSLENQSNNQKFIMGRTSDVDSLFQDMFPDAAEDITPVPNSINEQEAAKDRHEQYADLALAKWNSAMDLFVGQEHVAETYLVPSEQLTALTADIALLSRRLNLRDQLANKLRKNASLTGSVSLRGETQALLAEIEIGNFVYMLGYIDTPLDKRPMTRGLKGEYVFAPKDEVEGILVLPEQPVPYNERFVRDWISALVQRFEENAGSSELNGVDPAANELLGRIISVLEQSAK